MSLIDTVKQLSMTATEHNHETTVTINAIMPVIDEVITGTSALGMAEQTARASDIKTTLEEIQRMLGAAAEKIGEVTTSAEHLGLS